MEHISNEIRIPMFPPEIQAAVDRNMALSSDERLRRDCEHMNGEPGNLTGYDCRECLNRGFIYVVREGEIVCRTCSCEAQRNTLRRIKYSGLSGLIENCTFDSFQAAENWQQRMKAQAQRFAVDCTTGKWFYAGGQVGAGKTHICTAIVSELISKGMWARYMLWRDDSVRLKSFVNDDEEYQCMTTEFKEVPVLYIDDLFKTGSGKAPTSADATIAFEILNYRYINKQLVTIISSEWSVDDLIDLDEAVGSRIYERTKEYCLYIPNDRSRNWRLKS